MRSILQILFLCAPMCASCVCSASDEISKDLRNAAIRGAQGKATLRVVDNDGAAVHGAIVDVALFEKSSYEDVKTYKGVTGTNGDFVVEGRTIGQLKYGIERSGYYRTEGEFWFYSDHYGSVMDGRWLPWNPTVDILLKPVKSPAAMFAKRVETEAPVQGVPVGFDMEKGDWVAPYGQGIRSDFLINVSGHYSEMLDRHCFMTISFGHDQDGISAFPSPIDGSQFQSMYQAPLDGYSEKYEYEKKITRSGKERINPTPRKDKYYVFRVRTQTNSDGDIVSAHYGKVYGDIMCGFIDDKRIGVYFNYYFNPESNSQDLEFDPARNLFPNEHVYKP